MSRVGFWLLVGALGAGAALAAGNNGWPTKAAQACCRSEAGGLRVVTVRLYGEGGAVLGTVAAEVAESAAARRRGLSGRREVAAGTGMLFVFEPPSARACFWMKDTHVPLTALFADGDGYVMFVARMRPGSLETHCAGSEARRVRHVLEVLDGEGWAGVGRIGVGR